MTGSGPLPTAQVGRGSDGVYISSNGISITPAVVASLTTPVSQLTSLTQVSGTPMNLRAVLSPGPGLPINYPTTRPASTSTSPRRDPAVAAAAAAIAIITRSDG